MLKKTSLFFFFLLFLIVPASAFSDNFNDGDISDWNIVSGSWSAASGHLNNTASGGAGISNITHSISDFSYLTFNYYGRNVGSQSDYISWSPYQSSYLRFTRTAGGSAIGVSKYDTTDFNIGQFAIDNNTVVKFEFTINSARDQIRLVATAPNGTVYSDQSVAYSSGAPSTTLVIFNSLTSGTTNSFFIDDISTSTVSPSTLTSITLDKESYAVSDIATVTYSIASSFWSWAYTYDLSIYDSNNTRIKDFFGIGQSGTKQYQFDKQGSYKFVLGSCILCILSSYTELASVFTYANTYESYLFVPTKVPVLDYFKVTYNYGFTDSTIGYHNANSVTTKYQSPSGEYILEGAFDTIVDTSNHVIDNVVVKKKGIYLIELVSLRNGIVASKVVEAVESRRVPKYNITTSFINVSEDTVVMGSVVQGTYQIEDKYYANYRTYILYNNTDKNVITGTEGLIDQTGYFHPETRASGMIPYSGAYNITLVAQNDSATITLAYTLINVTATNQYGYGITIDKASYCLEDKVYYTLYIPQASTTFQVIRESNNYVIRENIYNISQTSNIHLNQRLFKGGESYALQLIDSHNVTQAYTSFKIDTCGVTTSTPTLNEENISLIYNSPYFYVITIIVFVMIAVGSMIGAIAVIVAPAVIFPLFYMMGMIPAWIVFLEALLIICVCVYITSKHVTRES